MAFPYRNRAEAGRDLAESLTAYANRRDVIVLGLPRGGVPVAYEVAIRLHAELDVYVVRKLGVPGHEELAMGAVAGDGTCVVDQALIDALGIGEDLFNDVVRRELEELHRRDVAYRDARPEPNICGKTVILVDDGLATGSTMRVAAVALRRRSPAAIVVAVPVAARQTCESLGAVADRVVAAHMPEPFHAVGLYYQDFGQTTDREVTTLLHSAAEMASHRWKVA
jgi:putative phosphoribosyl transferase